jgi:hypothetical protein
MQVTLSLKVTIVALEAPDFDPLGVVVLESTLEASI